MTSPTISGTVAHQAAADLVPIDPFVSVTISDDITPSQSVTITVTMSNPADGTFSDLGDGTYDAATGTYTATEDYAGFTPTNGLDADLNSLAFTPAGGLAPVGQSVTTAFTIAVNDTAGGSTTDSTTSVVANTGTFTQLASPVGVNLTSADLFVDSAGNLFGMSNEGGTSGFGTIFEIPNTNTGYASTPTVLVNFNGAGDGGFPYAQLIENSAGDLLGTVTGGGPDGDGTVFELASTGGGGFASTPSVLATFNGTDGMWPFAGLITDAAGDLFGANQYGGTGWTGGQTGDGTVFEILNTNTGYATTPITLTSNYGSGGSLTIDAAGDLFGSSSVGVFEIPFNNGTYASTPVVISFATSVGQLAIDHTGDLFGASSDGTVFEIANSSTGYPSLDSPLMTLATGIGSVFGFAGLLIDEAGDLFGTTSTGPRTGGAGVAFEIANTSTGYASTPDALETFPSPFVNGSTPYSGLVADADGDLFGTTQTSSNGGGTVFELSGAGFVTCFRRGTRIASPAGERTVEALAIGDDVLTASGESRAIVWIGRRHVDCRAQPAPERVWPVRIRAGAFGEALPRRDLCLSPDHAVSVDDALIPVKYLIDGAAIAQIPVDEVDYYHIELIEHDILLAEGLPAESYLDTGDRFTFDNGGAPAVRAVHVAWLWETQASAPLIATGPRLREARRRVAACSTTKSRIIRHTGDAPTASMTP